jgi:cell division protein FtsW
MPRKNTKTVDRFFLTLTLILVFLGLAMFVSASLGVLAKNSKVFYDILLKQIVLGLGLGFIGMYFTSRIDYKIWKKYAFYIFLGSILLTALVYIPGLGFSHGGALRWISLGPISFQPAEILKFGFIVYFAAWLSWAKHKVSDFRFGMLPLAVMLGLIALILLNQPDTKSFILISVTGIAMLFIGGVPMRYIFFSGLIITVALSALVFFTPYLQERIKTFINPSQNAQGSSYQIQQSLIAIGSGGVFGRGYGQSIQKFTYLPEPQGDSIFAVLGEELGFVGGIITIFLYMLWSLRGFNIANNAPDMFGRLLVSGIVILMIAQSFLHIASVIGVFPLTGVPLVFMSHGGTSLMIYLVAIGLILQVSKSKTIT